MVYLDDILIFSNSEREHLGHIRQVLEILRKNKLFAKPRKCEFAKDGVSFLGHRVSAEGVATEEDKVATIKNWPTPTKVTDLRSFLGLATYYQRFVANFASVALPLTALLKKDTSFVWAEPQVTAFNALKSALSSAPVLRVVDPKLPFVLHTDASGRALGAVLSQGEGDDCHPIAFTSRTLADAETRYPVHEKELLAVIHSLKHWRHYLLGSRLTIHTDHHSLKFIKTQATLSQRQARWLETLEDFDYEIVYQQGKTNVVADALSRVRSDLNELTLVVIDSDLATLLKTAYSKDPATADLLRKVTAADPTVKDFTLRNGLLYVAKDRELLYIPADPDLKKKIFSDCHDSATAGHLGLEKTLDFIRRSFFWPSLATEVKAYVSSCLACQRNKPSNAVPAGLLQPLEIPDNPWDCVSMDFVVQLPRTARGFDAIFVVVDKLTKYAHFIPTTTDVTADTTARLFFDNIFTYHGLPIKIVSDRDAKFTSNFWQGLFALLGTKLAMSTAFHPQTDGQTERMNRTLEQMLRFYVSYRQDDWDLYLPTCQFAVNNAKQASTGETPFYLNHGRHPGLPHTLLHCYSE